MSNKPFYEKDGFEKIVARAIAGLILFLFFLFMWVFNPTTYDKFSIENVWEAVHPFHWLKDTIGTIGFTSLCLYVVGWLGKAVYAFTEPKEENSLGLVHAVAAVGALSIILLFV